MFSFFVCLVVGLGEPQSPIDLGRAAAYFEEASWLSEFDGGGLWGVPLYGPMLFVDGATRFVVANQADGLGQLSSKGRVWVGTLPQSVPVANTAVEWAGMKWTMVMWPLPVDKRDRATLMMHECFHRIQSSIGLPASDPPNEHLDTEEGRYWLQLEWRALRKALEAEGAERKTAINDALLFRRRRHVLFANKVSAEIAQELNEGLAEYTGCRLSGRSERELTKWSARNLIEAEKKPTFVRSFAYATGPAYGLLLDLSEVEWRKGITPNTHMAELFGNSAGGSASEGGDTIAYERARAYDGDNLRVEEQKRAALQKQQLERYRKLFVTRRVLQVDLRKPNVEFDPGGLVPLDDLGTVYPKGRLVDAWGKLEVMEGGFLLDQGWSWARVPVAGDAKAPLSGQGWTLRLEPGWAVVPGTREGDWRVVKNSEPGKSP